MHKFLTVVAAAMIGLIGCSKSHDWSKVTDDDPRLEAAREQARSEYPEFVKLAKARQPMTMYTVEVKYEEGSTSEYLTLDALKVTDTEVTGVIIGYPQKVNLQSGATVTVPADKVSDWKVETPQGEVKGGFVEQERARLQRQD